MKIVVGMKNNKEMILDIGEHTFADFSANFFQGCSDKKQYFATKDSIVRYEEVIYIKKYSD